MNTKYFIVLVAAVSFITLIEAGVDLKETLDDLFKSSDGTAEHRGRNTPTAALYDNEFENFCLKHLGSKTFGTKTALDLFSEIKRKKESATITPEDVVAYYNKGDNKSSEFGEALTKLQSSKQT